MLPWAAPSALMAAARGRLSLLPWAAATALMAAPGAAAPAKLWGRCLGWRRTGARRRCRGVRQRLRRLCLGVRLRLRRLRLGLPLPLRHLHLSVGGDAPGLLPNAHQGSAHDKEPVWCACRGRPPGRVAAEIERQLEGRVVVLLVADEDSDELRLPRLPLGSREVVDGDTAPEGVGPRAQHAASDLPLELGPKVDDGERVLIEDPLQLVVALRVLEDRVAELLKGVELQRHDVPGARPEGLQSGEGDVACERLEGAPHRDAVHVLKRVELLLAQGEAA